MLFSVVLIQIAQAQQPKVLFLGNSYTGVNNLPDLVYSVAVSTGDTLDIDQSIQGGATFNMPTNSANTQAKIQAEDWDYVVL